MRIDVFRAAQLVRSVHVGPGTWVVGRDDACDLVIDDAGLSPRHARFDVMPTAVRLVDLQSTTGTYLAGRRLEGPVLLSLPTEFCVGASTMQVTADEPADRRDTPRGSQASSATPPQGRRRETTSAVHTPVGTPEVRLPSPTCRAKAFGVDVLIVAVVFGLAIALGKLAGLPRLGLAAVALAGWVYYVGVTAWLMGGQSAGKVIYGLNVRRIGTGSAPDTVRGLAWSVGRQTVGYLVVDVFLVGALLTLVDRRRRCLHDYAFASQVVQAAGGPQMHGSFTERYRAYWEEFSRRYDELNQRNRWFFFPWKWLSKALVVVAVVVDKLLPTRAEATVAAGERATPLSAKAAAALWATTSVATGAIAVAVTQPPRPDVLDLAGVWQLREVESFSQSVFNPTSFEGTLLEFERDGDTFRVVQGPEQMLGTELSPQTVGDGDVLARSETTSRTDCVNLSSGELVAADVYAGTTTWEFTGPDDQRPDRLAFQFVQIGEKDTDDPAAGSCVETTRHEVSATAERVATAQP